MSARLSHRVGRLIDYPPFYGLSPTEKLALARLVEPKGIEFEDLPERYQRFILEAEALRQRHKEATEAGTPQAVDPAWNDAVQRALEDSMPAVSGKY